VLGRVDRRVLLAATASVVVAAIAAFLALEDGRGDRVPGGLERSAQVTGALGGGRDGEGVGRKADAALVADRGELGADRDGPRWVSTEERVSRREALPCTGPRDPINFAVFSAGPAVGGVPMIAAVRRCDAGALADESRSNYLAYVYGRCQDEPHSGGSCVPPLQIRSYPACERTFVDYSFEGRPLHHKELPPIDGAMVYEIEFLVDHRIEVYTGTSTIVISAADWTLAEEALQLLRSQPGGEPPAPPATSASSLGYEPQGRLKPPAKAAIEGDLPCPV